ncbi:MAG: S9 family peptidase [Elusimicrobia bacterium]|nr:S9 family peptidase [Elusimicrobiota bacterium]
MILVLFAALACLPGALLAADVARAERAPYGAEQLTMVRRLSGLRISPDGCAIAFASDMSGSRELWTAPACGRGGALLDAPGWPEQLSYLDERVEDARYRPDGASILFSSDAGGNERMDLFLAGARGGAVERLTRTSHSEEQAEFSRDGRRLAVLSDPDRAYLFQLSVLDLATRESTPLTRESKRLRNPVWSPDGGLIAVTRSDDNQTGDVLVVDPSTGPVASIAPPVEGTIVRALAFSPDGKRLLLLAQNAAGFAQLALSGARGGAARFVGPSRWDVEEARWHPHAGIVFTANEGGRSVLYRMKTADAPAQPLLEPRGVISSIDLDRAGERLSFLWETTTSPAEAWVLDLKTGKKAQLTRSLAAGVRPEELSAGRMISYESFDGKTIHALYHPPRTASLGAPPPVIVDVHGGPDGQTVEDFHPLRLLLAEAGFAVLSPNYRGSTGYGRAFEDLNNKDWGGGDLQDLIAGVRHLAAQGLADPSRAGIEGGSYGGYMTLMALAKSSSVWAAGAEWYGMHDLAVDYALTRDRFGEWYRTEMGTPETHAELFKDRSPIHFLANVGAPLLIFQGANDTNVPRTESDQLYAKLLERRAPVGLIVYPDEGHGFTRRKNRVDHFKRTVEFFQKQLSKRPAAPAP